MSRLLRKAALTWCMEVTEDVAILTLNRPERKNAWTVGLQRAYFTALQAMAASSDVRVIVLTGAGNSFCPGADSEALAVYAQTGQTNPEATTILAPEWFPLTVSKPLIAAVDGPCAGVGLAQALMCDIRVAADTARFSTAFARRGLPTLHGTGWLLTRIVGHATASDLLLSARTIDASSAREIGLVHEVVPADQLLDRVRERALELARTCSPEAMAMAKRQLLESAGQSVQEAMEMGDELIDVALLSADFREGVASLLERRTPRFGPLVVASTGFVDQ